MSLPSAFSEKNDHAYGHACARIEHQITRLAQAKGIALTVEIDFGRTPYAARSDSHQIQLHYGHRRWVVVVDHDTFMNDQLFKTLVLHHIPAAIDKLAGISNMAPAREKPAASKDQGRRSQRSVKHDQPPV